MVLKECCSEQERQEVIDKKFISYYGKMLEQEDWLSDEIKEYEIEKLKHITIHACFSDVREDYSDLSFVSEADGGTYWEARQAIGQYDLAMQRKSAYRIKLFCSFMYLD